MTYNSEFKPASIPDGVVIVDGQGHMRDGKGALVPVELIKPAHKLEDQTVRNILGFAVALSDQIARFQAHTMQDLEAFDALLAEKYDLKKGGKKGNRTYLSHDQLMKVTVQVADRHDFGPELQVAKNLFDECLNEWSADAHPAIRAIITRAFSTKDEGKYNRTDLISLMRYQIEDERWQRAVNALRDAMRVIGSKEYVRFHRRADIASNWEPITIDLAKV